MLPPASGEELSIKEDDDYVFEGDVRLPLELDEVLGQGSSAIVERVHDTQTGRIFALKKFTFARARARALKEEAFKREVAIIRRLAGHHHIIRAYATFVAKLKFGLILDPAADEGNLEKYLGAYWDLIEEPDSSGTNVAAMTSVLERAFGCLASGLAFMHSRDIRRKDIKPQNILIHRGTVIYTDFGCAKDGKQTGSNTTEGPTELTRRYAPPEVLEFEYRNFAADVYCLGCVFVELLAAASQQIIYEQDIGFSHIMDMVHDNLASISIAPRLSFLPNLIISMTGRDRTQRPRADVVFANMSADDGFFCSECSRSHRDPAKLTSWKWSATHGRDYCHLLNDDEELVGRVWSHNAQVVKDRSLTPVSYDVAIPRYSLYLLVSLRVPKNSDSVHSDEHNRRQSSSSRGKSTSDRSSPKASPKKSTPSKLVSMPCLLKLTIQLGSQDQSSSLLEGYVFRAFK